MERFTNFACHPCAGVMFPWGSSKVWALLFASANIPVDVTSEITMVSIFCTGHWHSEIWEREKAFPPQLISTWINVAEFGEFFSSPGFPRIGNKFLVTLRHLIAHYQTHHGINQTCKDSVCVSTDWWPLVSNPQEPIKLPQVLSLVSEWIPSVCKHRGWISEFLRCGTISCVGVYNLTWDIGHIYASLPAMIGMIFSNKIKSIFHHICKFTARIHKLSAF